MRRVVVTGLGGVTPLGLDIRTTWRRVCAGESGIRTIVGHDTEAFGCRIGGQVLGFTPEDWVSPREAPYMDAALHFAAAAGKQALDDARVLETVDGDRIGCNVSTGGGGLNVAIRGSQALQSGGPRRVSPLVVPFALSSMPAGFLSVRHGLRGPSHNVSSACASSADAIGIATDLIRYGRADAMLTGGTDNIVPTMLASFVAARAVTLTGNERPEKASRPFDATRDGFVPAEGAVALLLEEREHAIARGATLYGEVVGYGAASDGFHLSAPQPDGDGAARALILALADAKLPPEQIGYINAHATSTPQGDIAEVKAIRRVFGSSANRLAVSGTKSMTGHLLGAAGALEAALTLLALRDGVLPPTTNYASPDPACDLDFIPNVARKVDVEFAASNSFGFGGHCTSLVFRKS